MKDVSLTLVQTFHLVAKEGSYSGAARKLNISYQSVANHIRRFEQILGEKLVISEQGAKSTMLTARGKTLYHLLVPELDAMLSRLNTLVDKERPVIRLGMPQAIFYYLLPQVISDFNEIHPDVQIVCYERDVALVDLIKIGQVDAFITERPYVGDEVVQHTLGAYKLFLVYPSDWPAPSSLPSLADWADGRPYVTFEPGHMLRNMALDLMRQDGKAPQVAISASSSSSVKRCVEKGLGFTILPGWTLDGIGDNLSTVLLDELKEIPVYFGESRYLAKNPYISLLRDLCAKNFSLYFTPGNTVVEQ
ncbi:LysR family transcriptional regulator [Mesorhizobium sp. NPDC059054]|uniref:LysR family transcriptional regulator n=1 Tax=Mesorhizobium sp. NPDC059054 TaxID=3346711 RepID=UPI0036ABE898